MREPFIRTSVEDCENSCNVILLNPCILFSTLLNSSLIEKLPRHVDQSHFRIVPAFVKSNQTGLSDFYNLNHFRILLDCVSPNCTGLSSHSKNSTTQPKFKMDPVKMSDSSALPSMDQKASSAQHKDHHRQKCERREKLSKKKTSANPVLHPDVEHAQTEENRVFRFNEDCRPMFSPVPRNSSSDGECDDSPRQLTSKPAKEKLTFPAIHVDKCEKSQPSYAVQPLTLPPSTHMAAICTEVQHETLPPGLGGLNVPSPYLHRKSDGRLLLMTQDSNRSLVGPWSRSEGNLPDAVRCSSSPANHTNLLDIKYRPSWQGGTTLRPSSDVALHELRREGGRSPATPRRLPVRLEPLPDLATGQRALSATNLQSP